MRDAELMARAIEVGDRGRRTAPPNPWVGCVLVKDGEKLMGIITGSDILKKLSGPTDDLAAVTCGKIMTPDPACLDKIAAATGVGFAIAPRLMPPEQKPP